MGYLEKIQECILEERYQLTEHFIEEMRKDLLFFIDIEVAILEAHYIIADGADDQGNPKFRVRGKATDGREIELVCSIKQNGDALFITVYVV